MKRERKKDKYALFRKGEKDKYPQFRGEKEMNILHLGERKG